MDMVDSPNGPDPTGQTEASPVVSNLIKKCGILILRGSGEDTANIDWDSLVEDEREERIRKIASL